MFRVNLKYAKRYFASESPYSYNKNYPQYLYKNPKGEIETVMVGPRMRGKQVYDRSIHDPRFRKFWQWVAEYYVKDKRVQFTCLVIASFLLDKFWQNTLVGLVSYNNRECTMLYAIQKENEWSDKQEAEKARRKALGLPEEGEEEEAGDDE